MEEKPVISAANENKDTERVSFEDLFNLDEIQRLQDEFTEATGVASIITHTDGRPITAPSNFCHLCMNIIRKTDKGLKNCYKSDAAVGRFSLEGPIVQQCLSGGLWDAGAGITVGGQHIANWLIGQVRDETQAEEDMIKYAQEIGADEQAFIEAFREVPSMSRSQFGKIAKMLFTLANQLSTTAYQNMLKTRAIAERNKVEKSLRESEMRYRNFVSHASEGIYRVDIVPPVKIDLPREEFINKVNEYAFVAEVNKALADMYGLNPKDMVGKRATDYAPDYGVRVSCLLKNSRYQVTGMETLDVDKDGNPLLLIESFHGNVNKGHLVQVWGVQRDVTKIKKAEEDLMRLASTVEQASESIMILNIDGLIQYINPVCEQVFSMQRHDAIGKKFTLNLANESKNLKKAQEVWEALQHGETWKGHMAPRKKDGSACEMDITVSPLRDHSGEISGFVSIGRDVTQEMKLDNQVRQSQKMESIGTLAGGIAHDFNNILSAVMGYTELGLDDVKDRPMTYESLTQVLNAANRAKDLVSQILTFSRSTTVSKTSIKAIPVVQEVCKFMRASLPTTIEINQKITATNDWIIADPTQLYQVLLNLCTNAGHAMNDTGGKLEVILEELLLEEDNIMSYSDLKAGPYLKLTVKDTGHGISKENLDRIFEPYFTTKEKGSGTGLGLAVVHGIVKDYGGDIKAYSEVDKGTVFHVLFPRIEKVKDTDTSIDSELIPNGVESIIFVDDEEMLVNLGKKTLEGLGYKVTGFTSAEEATKTFKNSKESYDLVITDKTMPRVTGFDLAREIKKVRPDIPILLCTGFQDKDIENKTQEAGISGYIMKPVNRQELAVAVRKVLDKNTE